MSSTRKLRPQQLLLLLRAVAKMVAAQQPLDRGLMQLAQQWRGSLARAAEEASRRLASGQSLPSALSAGDDYQSRTLAAAIEAGLHTNQVDVAIESWLTLRLSRERAWHALIIAMIYPVLLFLVIAGSLLFTLHHLTPHYRNAFASILGHQPDWIQLTSWFSEHLLLTLCLLLLLPGSMTAWWLGRRLVASKHSPAIEVADRWYMHAHVARLAELFLAKHCPIDATLESLSRAAGRIPSADNSAVVPTASQDRSLPIYNDAQAHAWMGRDTVLALVALHDGAMTMNQVRDLLRTIATQTQRMADIRSAHNAQWLPMVAATTGGIVIVLMYVGLIYGPWLSLFHAIAR